MGGDMKLHEMTKNGHHRRLEVGSAQRKLVQQQNMFK